MALDGVKLFRLDHLNLMALDDKSALDSVGWHPIPCIGPLDGTSWIKRRWLISARWCLVIGARWCQMVSDGVG